MVGDHPAPATARVETVVDRETDAGVKTGTGVVDMCQLILYDDDDDDKYILECTSSILRLLCLTLIH